MNALCIWGREGKGLRCRIRVATTFWRLNRCLMAKAGHFWGALRSCFRGELTVRRGTLMSPGLIFVAGAVVDNVGEQAVGAGATGLGGACAAAGEAAGHGPRGRLVSAMFLVFLARRRRSSAMTSRWLEDDEVIWRSCTPGGSADGRGGPHAVMDKERDDLRKALYVLLQQS